MVVFARPRDPVEPSFLATLGPPERDLGSRGVRLADGELPPPQLSQALAASDRKAA